MLSQVFLLCQFVPYYVINSIIIFPLCGSFTPFLNGSLLFYSFESFSYQRLVVLYWSLTESKSSHVSRTLLSILADLNNAVVWMVSTCSLISKSSSPCTNYLVTIPSAPITISITVTFMFHSFFSSLARCRYVSLFSLPFSFSLWSVGTAESGIRQVPFFFFFSFFDYY